MFTYEFCKIFDKIFFKEPFGQLLLHKHLQSFQKWCHTYFLAEYFLGLKKSRRRLQDVLETSWRRLEDVWPRRIYWSWPRHLEVVLKTSSEDVRLRRTYSSLSRRLLKTKRKDVFKTSSRRLYQDECLLGWA